MKLTLQIIAAAALVMSTEYVIVKAAFGTLHSLVHSQSLSAGSR